MKIYLVEGSTGEYSDRSDWIVCAYRSKEKAEWHASEANRRSKEIASANRNWSNQDCDTREANEFDPGFQMDYTGTWYGIIETELK